MEMQGIRISMLMEMNLKVFFNGETICMYYGVLLDLNEILA